MADNSEKVPEDNSDDNRPVQQQMLPPPPPLNTKNKGKKTAPSNSSENSDISSKMGAQNSEAKITSNLKGRDSNLLKTTEQADASLTVMSKQEEEEKNQAGETSVNKTLELNRLPPKAPPKADLPSDKLGKSSKDSEKKDSYPDIPYTEPSWAGIPQEPYYLELLKGGCIISTIRLTSKTYYLFGRLPNCDMVMEHPSISRYHAIIQYKASDSSSGKKGFYLYDLGSTHGTKVNKIAIHPKRYYRLQVGYVIKFGGSSRLYILQGPEDLEDNESQEAVVKQSSDVGKVMTEAEYEEWKKEKERKPEEGNESCSWGFGEDAQEEDVINPFASELEEETEAHVFKDPKKTLRGFFEREGLELEYQVEETGPGHARVYHCRVKLPVEDANGDPLYAEAAITGKKREAVLACAAEACRILDVNGLLRQSSHESKKQKLKNWADNDYYDSDEDTFLDRTGSIEKKRLKRMKMDKKEKEVETFESLNFKLQSVEEEIKSLEARLEEAVKAAKAAEESEDSLESYMKNIDQSMDRTSRMAMRRRIFELKKEKQKLSKLVDLSRPASLPSLVKKPPKTAEDVTTDVNKSEADSSVESVSETADPITDTRHQQAELVPSEPDLSTSEEKEPVNTTQVATGISVKSDNEQTFMKPKMVPPSSRHKTTPSSSISMLLEGLKESNNKERLPKTEKRLRKQQPDSNEEPKHKKKAKLPSLPLPTQDDMDDDNPEDNNVAVKFDENYSDWVPPTDQTGDGKTKLNAKYGY